MPSSTSNTVDRASVNRENRRREQEEADRRLAESLYHQDLQLLQNTSAEEINMARVGTNQTGSQNRGARGGARRGRCSRANATTPAATSEARRMRTDTPGPDRTNSRVARNVRSSGGSSTRPVRAVTQNPNRYEFNGDRLHIRHGNDVIDITDQAYFPDSDDDIGTNRRVVRLIPRATRGASRGTNRGAARRETSRGAARGAARVTTSGASRTIPGATSRGSAGRAPRGRGARRRAPEINGGYISMIINNMMGRNQSNDADLESLSSDSDIDDTEDIDDVSSYTTDDEVMADESVPVPDVVLLRILGGGEEHESDGTIEISSDSEDEEEEEEGSLQRDRNHINQPIHPEDVAMYQRELVLYHDNNDYQVPPEQVPMDKKGKPIAPDSTWGDCTMCSNPPIKPQGCKKCSQFLGCSHCVQRWHLTSRTAPEGASCPLCRGAWKFTAPDVILMKNIVKRLEKRQTPKEEVGEISATSIPSTSSAK